MGNEPVRFVVRRLARTECALYRDRLRTIFREAVRVTGPQRYTHEQTMAWATTADDVARWDGLMREASVWVATNADDAAHAIGTAMTHPANHVDSLYVDPTYQRRGVASALLAAIERDARDREVPRLHTEASLVAHPVFARAGYSVTAWEEVERKGALFRRARMEKFVQ